MFEQTWLAKKIQAIFQQKIYIYQVFQSDPFGMVSSRDPFQWLSDLQLGDEKVTLNHLVYIHLWVDLPILVYRRLKLKMNMSNPPN